MSVTRSVSRRHFREIRPRGVAFGDIPGPNWHLVLWSDRIEIPIRSRWPLARSNALPEVHGDQANEVETAAAGIVPHLMRCWGAVVELGVQLNRTGTVRHVDVCAALGIPAKDNAMVHAWFRFTWWASWCRRS